MKTLLLVVLLVLVACSTQNTELFVSNVNPAEAKKLLDDKENINLFVLNVHTPYEGKLDKTDAIIENWENITAHTDQLPVDKNQPILVYCRTGRMSTVTVKQLQELGYTKLYHLDGGMKAWDAAGLPVIDKSWK